MASTGPAVALYAKNDQAYGFVVDGSGGLWYAALSSSGTATWNSLGGVCTASPAAIAWGSSSSLRLDVFVRGSDGAVWQKYYQNGWSGWIPLGGQLAPGTGPAVASWSAGRLDVFAEGTNGALWHKWWNGSKWSGWESLAGKLTASPAAMAFSSGGAPPYTYYINVFVRGADGAVWQKNWTGTAWSSWHSFGGQVAANTGPAVTSYFDLFVQGTDHKLYQMHYDESGATWTAFNLQPPEALAIASPGAVMTDANMHPLVAVSSTSGTVWYSLRDSVGHWETWYSAGSPP
jgi:hypothetical protein